MLLSVVIPTCHREKDLRSCLRALHPDIQQLTHGGYEIIVTDDGSAWTAEQMIREEFPFACWVRGPRRGPAANRNHGAEQAHGEWIVFLDDDCVPDAGLLDAYRAAIAPGYAAYEGKIICKTPIASPLWGAPVNLNGGCFWSCNIMVQRSRFLELGGFNTVFPRPAQEDVDLRERLKQRGPIRFVQNAVVEHPPRRRNLGKRAALIRESQVVLWYLCGKTEAPVIPLTKAVLVENLRRIGRYPLSGDSIKAVGYTVVELVYLLLQIGAWQRKYQAQFRGTIPPYPYPYGQG